MNIQGVTLLDRRRTQINLSPSQTRFSDSLDKSKNDRFYQSHTFSATHDANLAGTPKRQISSHMELKLPESSQKMVRTIYSPTTNQTYIRLKPHETVVSLLNGIFMKGDNKKE